MTMQNKLATGIFWLTLALIAAAGLSLIVGDANIFKDDIPGLLKIRLSRTLMAMVIGAGLSLAGLILQAVLRNPLADPYVLGVSSGAGLGAAGAILFGATALGFWPLPLAAFIGGMLAVIAVYFLARTGKTVPVYTLLLAGAIVNSVAGSLLIFLAHVKHDLPSVMWWLLGSLQVLEGWDWQFGIAASTTAAVFVVAMFCARDLNVLSLGEEPAAHLGVRVERTKKILFVAASLVTGAAVATCGLIGFVGLIVPHAVRLVVGPDNRVLIPLSALAGAVFLVIADIIARTAYGAAELPIGIVTAFIGGPFFIYLLRRRRAPSR